MDYIIIFLHLVLKIYIKFDFSKKFKNVNIFSDENSFCISFTQPVYILNNYVRHEFSMLHMFRGKFFYFFYNKRISQQN